MQKTDDQMLAVLALVLVLARWILRWISHAALLNAGQGTRLCASEMGASSKREASRRSRGEDGRAPDEPEACGRGPVETTFSWREEGLGGPGPRVVKARDFLNLAGRRVVRMAIRGPEMILSQRQMSSDAAGCK